MIKLNKLQIFSIVMMFLFSSMFSSLFRFLPVPLSSFRFYEALMLLVILLQFSKFFLTQYFWIVILFILVFSFGYFTIWEEIRDYEAIDSYGFNFVSKHFEPLLLGAVSVFFISKVKRDETFRLPVRFFVPIMLICSFIYFILFSDALNFARGAFARQGGGVARTTDILGYDFIYSIAFIAPIFAFLYEKFKESRKKKIVLITVIIVYFFCIIKSGYATALITAFLFFLIALITKGNIIKYRKTIIAISLVVFLIPIEFIADLFYGISSFIPQDYIATKFNDLGDLFSAGEFTTSGGDGYLAKDRFSKIEPLKVSFFSNPYIGGGINTGHHFWLDTASLFGLLGIFIWILVFSVLIKGVLSNVQDDFRPYLKLCFLSFILVAFIKGGTIVIKSILILFLFAPLVPYMFKLDVPAEENQ